MRFFCIIVSFFLITQAVAHQAPTKRGAPKLAVNFAVDQQDRLWRVGVNQGFVEVAVSSDFGKTFSSATRVNSDKQRIAARGEMRPKIAIGHRGEVYVVWMQKIGKRHAGHIWFARSTQDGKQFEQPMIVHQDRSISGHEFEELVVSADGQVTVLWLDERNFEAEKPAEEKRKGRAIYYATSQDAGVSFVAEKKLVNYACECCRIATTTKPDGTVVAMWRHVFKGGERDHMIAEVPKAAEEVSLHRATFGGWKIDGCPHHGASLARGGEGDDWWGYHLAYFDGKDKKPGLYYSRMDGEAWVTFPAKHFGNHAKQARHPVVLSRGQQVWLAWLETAENNAQAVMLMASDDEGRSWSDARMLFQIDGKTDYPQLLHFKDAAYVVVNTGKGLKVHAIQP